MRLAVVGQRNEMPAGWFGEASDVEQRQLGDARVDGGDAGISPRDKLKMNPNRS